MVNQIIKFFNREQGLVNEAALVLGLFAFLSQILGLVRDRMLISLVGAGPTLDVYYAAFRIPDFLYISVASLASVTVLLPFVVERMDNKENVRRFLNSVFSAYMLFMFLASLLIAILMPRIAHMIAPGFSEQQIALLVTTSRIMLFSPIFIGLSNLLGTITQLFKNFLVFSLSPVFYNIGILLGIIFMYPVFGVYGLAYGVVIGALMHLFIQVPVIIKHGFFPQITRYISWQEIAKVIRISLPRTVALSCNSLVFVVLIALASKLVSGSISLFTFAYNLQSVPVGIIGISYSVAAFPVLVQSYTQKNMGKFIDQILGACRNIIFWSVPIMSLLVVLRAQIVRVVLGSHSFSWVDTRLTAASVALFILSLTAQCLVLLFVRGYYATGNTKKPLIINVFSSIMIIVFAYIFFYVFRVYPDTLSRLEYLLRVHNVAGTQIFALPLAYTLGSILNFVLMYVHFKRDFLRNTNSGLFRTFIQSAISALIMGLGSYIMLGLLDGVFDISTGYGLLEQGFVSGFVGIILGIIALLLMKNQEFKSVFDALNHKFWKGRVFAPEQKEL